MYFISNEYHPNKVHYIPSETSNNGIILGKKL
jgi:hypothetical protein